MRHEWFIHDIQQTIERYVMVMSTIFKLPLFVVCYSQQSLTFKREAVMKDRLREPSPWGGIGFNCLQVLPVLSHDYATGTVQIITGLMAVLRPEAIGGAK